jgi:hypothetical protein
MGELGDFLRILREESHYPSLNSLAEHLSVEKFTIQRWERESIPQPTSLDHIVERLHLSKEKEAKLRLLWHREKAQSLGVDLNAELPKVNVSEVAAKIQREVEYELKRVGHIKLTPRTRRVCVARIEMILRSVLGDPCNTDS